MSILKNINLAVAFLLELVMLAAFAYWGFTVGEGTLVKIVLGIGVPVLVIAIWSIFLAPRASRHLTGIPELILKGVIFGLAALALAAANHPLWGLALAVVFVVNYILVAVLGSEPST